MIPTKVGGNLEVAQVTSRYVRKCYRNYVFTRVRAM